MLYFKHWPYALKPDTFNTVKCFFLWCSGYSVCVCVMVYCHMLIPFVVWIKALLVTALTFRPRCTWAVWGPSCGAAAGTGPGRCSAGTDPASAWTPGYDTGCQLAVQATARLEILGIMHPPPFSLVLTLREKHIAVVMKKKTNNNLWIQLWEHFQLHRWRVVTLENKSECLISVGSRDNYSGHIFPVCDTIRCLFEASIKIWRWMYHFQFYNVTLLLKVTW